MKKSKKNLKNELQGYCEKQYYNLTQRDKDRIGELIRIILRFLPEFDTSELINGTTENAFKLNCKKILGFLNKKIQNKPRNQVMKSESTRISSPGSTSEPNQRKITIVETGNTGDCLFNSVAYGMLLHDGIQASNSIVNSPAHKDLSKNLRKYVVDLIKVNANNNNNYKKMIAKEYLLDKLKYNNSAASALLENFNNSNQNMINIYYDNYIQEMEKFGTYTGVPENSRFK